MKEQHFLAIAKRASANSDHRDHRIGCVIVRGNRILGIGYNLLKTHPQSPHKHKSTHAEFRAVLAADRHVEGATAYIFRQQKNGIPSISRPCKTCWEYLMRQGIKKVVYTFEGSFKEERL